MVYKETLSKSCGDSMGIERVLFDAVFNGRVKYLTRLLESGFNPNVTDDFKMSLLTHACLIEKSSTRMELVKLLLHHGALPDVRDKYNMDTLMHATLAGLSGLIPMLVNHSRDWPDLRLLSTEGYPLLSMAVISEDVRTVRLINDLHVKVGLTADDVANFEGVTPFMEAKRRNLEEIADYLRLEGKASPLRMSQAGKTVDELTEEFQRNKEREFEMKMNEVKMINPPRYSLLHPVIKQTPSMPPVRSKSVSFMPSREDTRVTFDKENTFLPWEQFASTAKDNAIISLGKLRVIRNAQFVNEFQPKIKSFEALKNEQAKEKKVSSEDDLRAAELNSMFCQQSERTSDLQRQNFETEQVVLDNRELSLMRKADRRYRRKQQKQPGSRLHVHVGYGLTVPEDIQKQFSSQKEKSFTLRRPSRTRVDNQVW